MKVKLIILTCALALTACGTKNREEKTYIIETHYIQNNGNVETLVKECHYNTSCIVELEVAPRAGRGETLVHIESLRMQNKKDKEWLFKTHVKTKNPHGKMIETREEIYTTSGKMSSSPLVIKGADGSQIQIHVLPAPFGEKLNFFNWLPRSNRE